MSGAARDEEEWWARPPGCGFLVWAMEEVQGAAVSACGSPVVGSAAGESE
jgi:hypothetical protein